MSFLVDLAVRPIWTDEALSYYQVSAKTLLEMLDSFNSGVNAIPYLYFIVLWGIDQVFGLGPVILRLPSAVFALAALFLFHTILKERFGNAVAFVSCVAALLLSENFIPFSHEARPYSLYVLVAVCCLYASITILKEGAGRGRALLLNSVVAFTLPAVHYVGLFYSFGAALAVLCVGRVKGKFFTLRVLGSFVFGWAVFFVLHYSQMKLFIEKKGMIDATWIPRRSLREAYYVAASALTLPPIISGLLIALVGFYLLSGNTKTIRVNCDLDRQERLLNAFLFATSLFWLALPPIFYVLSAMGLPNLALPRYFVPSQLAVAAMAALLLWPLCVVNENDNTAGERWFGAQRDFVGVILVLVSLAYLLPGAVKAIVQAPSRLSQSAATLDFPYMTGTTGPWITNNIHIFFKYTFYRGTRPKLYLLRRTQTEVDGFKRFNGQLEIISEHGLSMLPNFNFIYKKGTINSLLGFDIHSWCNDNGYEITDESRDEGVVIFAAKKLF